MYAVLIVGIVLTFLLLRNGWHKIFIGICSNRQSVVLVKRNHQGSTQTQVGWQELTVFLAAECNFTTDVGNIQTNTQLTFALTDIDVILIIGSNICGKSGSWGVLLSLCEAHI